MERTMSVEEKIRRAEQIYERRKQGSDKQIATVSVNNEKKDMHDGKYNLTIEFNPNKLKDNKLVIKILSLSDDWYIKSYDIAFDLRININDIIDIEI